MAIKMEGIKGQKKFYIAIIAIKLFGAMLVAISIAIILAIMSE
ncbi:MAG: hypothetical protein QXY10_00975 [Candidatus Micrarchaeaceae archaeon]